MSDIRNRAQQAVSELVTMLNSGELETLSSDDLKGISDDLFMLAREISVRNKARGGPETHVAEQERKPVGVFSRLVHAWTSDTSDLIAFQEHFFRNTRPKK